MEYEYSKPRQAKKKNHTGESENIKMKSMPHSAGSFNDTKMRCNFSKMARSNPLAYMQRASMPIAPVQEKHQTGAASPVIQKYALFQQDNKAYSISSTGKAICGIEYPNHELYVRDMNDLIKPNESALITLKETGESKTFNRLQSESGKVEYKKVAPEWKEEYQIDKDKNLSYFIEMPDKDGRHSLNGMAITPERQHSFSSVRTNMDTLRKFVTLLFYKWHDQIFFKEIFKKYQAIYIPLHKIFDEGGGSSEEVGGIAKRLQELKETFMVCYPQENQLPSVYDNVSIYADIAEIYEPIIQCMSDIITALNEISKTNVGKDEMRFSLFLDILSTHDILLPRGCDLVAGLFGNTKDIVNPERVPILKFKVLKYNGDKHHFATIILYDLADFITIEGFAKKGYEVMDNTWEYYMHGHFRENEETAFNEYTSYRYMFFEEFKNGLSVVPTPPDKNVPFVFTGRPGSPFCTSLMKDYITKRYCHPPKK